MPPPPRRPSSRLPQNPDPTVTPPGRPEANPVLATPQIAVERGVVLEADARRHTYRVMMNSGRVISMGRLRTSPGDTALLDHGTNVAVFMGLGEPYIFGILPLGTAHSDGDASLSGLDGHGGRDPTLDRRLTVSARDPNAPSDLLPGDAALLGPDGASVAALRGKVAQLQGGPLARVQAFGDADLVQITAGELRTATWVGESSYTNEGGRTNFRWRGGTNQTTQTGADEARYTIALDVGSEGDVIKLELTNREGQALFRLHVDAHGKAELFTAGGFVHTGGDHADALREHAHHGASCEEVTGDQETRTGGDRTDHVVGAWNITTGGAVQVLSGADLDIIGVNSSALRSGGEVLVSATDLVRIAGRGVTIDPKLGAFLVDTSIADKIVLGSGATSHGVKYEELLQILNTIVSQLNGLAAAVAGHTHVGSSPSPTLSGFLRPLTVNMTPAKATVVLIK